MTEYAATSTGGAAALDLAVSAPKSFVLDLTMIHTRVVREAGQNLARYEESVSFKSSPADHTP